jgi:hypothetical protein
MTTYNVTIIDVKQKCKYCYVIVTLLFTFYKVVMLMEVHTFIKCKGKVKKGKAIPVTGRGGP